MLSIDGFILFILFFFALQAIKNNLPPSEMIESCSIAGPGFVNVVLSKNWMAKVLYLLRSFI